MKSTIRKVMMLAVLLVGYVSVMGVCACEECCNKDNYVTPCNSDSGYCLNGECIPGDSAPVVNRCGGQNEGDPCQVDAHTGTCVLFKNVLSCLVELPSP